MSGIDLHGWDLVYVLDVAEVNDALMLQRSKLIQSFQIETPMAARGEFGKWMVLPGGAGKYLDMTVTLVGSLTPVPNGPSKPISRALLRFQVDLQMLPTPDGHELSLANETIRAARFLMPPPGMAPIDAQALADAIGHYLAAHAQDISFVLASISPTRAGAPEWLTPVVLDFAYVPVQGESAALAIFVATSQKDTSGFAKNVDPALVEQGKAGLGISDRLFMQNVFLPALASAYSIPPERLALTIGSHIECSGNIGLPSVSEAGEDYHPELTSLTADLNDDRIHIALGGDCDLGMDASVSFDGSSDVMLSLAGPNQLAFTSANPTFDHDTHIPWYDHLLDIAGGVATIIFETTIHVIADELESDIGSVAGATAICAQAPNIVTWVGSAGLTPTDVRLAGGLVLHGSVNS